MNRVALAMKGIATGFGVKILGIIMGFVSRTLFIHFLGVVYLGVNGLYSNILSVLSFANLGFDTAISFAMYKPIAQNDKEKVIQLIDYYKWVYRIVALVIAIMGLALVPALPYLVKGADNLTTKQLVLYYLIFLFNTVVSYFVTYKLSYVVACQKNYILNLISTILNFVTFILQVIVLVIFKNFTIYLITQSLILLLSRIFISFYLNWKFPIVKAKPQVKLPKEDKKGIFSNVKGLLVHQIATISVHATDNIIISSMISVVVVGYVSNYNLIITNVAGFLTIIFGAFAASFGNAYATQTKDEYYRYFKIYNFVDFWLYGFVCVAFFVLIPPFITLWIGKGNLIDGVAFALMILDLYLSGQSAAFNTARNAIGNFNKDKWWALLQAAVNLVVSIVGAYFLGLIGVYIGTICSRLVYVIFRPMSTFQLMFERSSKTYYVRQTFFLVVVVIAAIVAYFATKSILAFNHWGWFILACFIVLFASNAIFLLATCWTKDFRNTVSFILNRLKRKGKKNQAPVKKPMLEDKAEANEEVEAVANAKTEAVANAKTEAVANVEAEIDVKAEQIDKMEN